MPAPPTLYLAHAQWPVRYLTVVAKSRGDAASLIEPMRAVLRDLDPDVPMYAVRSMDQIVSNAIAQPRLYLMLIATFAGTAMLLAAIGLYGVLAYAVGQRTREIGIRLALGAKRGEVLRMVMTQAARLAVAGVGDRARRSGDRQPRAAFATVPGRTDGRVTYVMVGVGLLVVALVASWIPPGAHRESIR